jgi:hypothetical protein
MKLVLDKEEVLALLVAALTAQGFENVKEIILDLGDGAELPVEAINGLIVKL